TESGLLRFDGVRTVKWQPPPGESLPSNDIRDAMAGRDGTLWLGTAKGLASWKDGKLTQYPELAGSDITTIVEDHEGTVWAGEPNWEAGFSAHGKLCAIKDRHVRCYGSDGRFGFGVTSGYEDSRHNLWLGAGNGIWRWKPDPPMHYTLPAPMHSGLPALLFSRHAFMEDSRGALLIAGYRGIGQLVDGKIEPYPFPSPLPQFREAKLLRDRDGSLWIGTLDAGLLHVHQGRMDIYTAADGLSGNSVEGLFEDREGNIWVATIDGLDRFRNYAVPRISVKQGLSSPLVVCLLAAQDGSVWLGTSDGLNRWKDGQVTIYRNPDAERVGVPGGHESAQKPGKNVREVAARGLPDNYVGSLFQDQQGRIWISTLQGLAYFEDGRITRLSDTHLKSLSPIDGDDAGNLWVTNSDQGLFRLREGKVVQQFPWASLGLRGSLSMPLATDRHEGLWLGSWNGGVVYFKDGRVRASYTAKDGLGAGRVNSLKLDPDGTLWAATDGGLSRIKDGHVTTLTSRNGLPCDSVHDLIDDDTGALWIYMACGLARVPRSELEAWATDPVRRIQITVFDASDGVRSHAGVYNFGPRAARTPDGKLWLLPLDGVSVVDPRHLSSNRLAPPVHIEQIVADGKSYWQNLSGDPSSSHPKLPPLVRDLTVDYTALSFVAPEKVRFRFRLEGQDKNWREVVNERRVEYSNLVPGHYRFRVIASNNSGVWNEQGASLDFTITPAYYQTNWFRALCAAAVLALVLALYRFRIRRLQQQERKFREVIETIPAMAFTARPDGSRTFVNRRWLDYTGLGAGQAAGLGWHAAVHPDDLDRVRENWRVSVVTGEPLEYETRLRGTDGGDRWFLTRAVPLRDARGNIRRWYGVTTDIEDRKQAEEARAEIEEQWRAAFVSNPTMYFIVDAARDIVVVNRFGAEQLGYDVAELLGQPLLDVVYEPDREAVQKHAQECFEQPGRMMRWEARNIRKDGAMLWVRETANAVSLKNRPVLLVVCEDITEQKRAEEAARRSESEL
ncbi:MAG: PAS domain S-box protein, partial [Silvibacterium sp.]